MLERAEDVLDVNSSLSRVVERIGKDIEHKFAVRVRVHVAMSLFVEVFVQLRSIDKVSVVGKAKLVDMSANITHNVLRHHGSTS